MNLVSSRNEATLGALALVPDNGRERTIEKILVGITPGTHFDNGLTLAAQLAVSHDAELVVLEVESSIDARTVFDPDAPPRRSIPVRRLNREFPGLRARASGTRGLPLRALCDVADHEQPDLIVVAHDSSRRRRGFLPRRATAALVRRSPCAVVLVAA